MCCAIAAHKGVLYPGANPLWLALKIGIWVFGCTGPLDRSWRFGSRFGSPRSGGVFWYLGPARNALCIRALRIGKWLMCLLVLVLVCRVWHAMAEYPVRHAGHNAEIANGAACPPSGCVARLGVSDTGAGPGADRCGELSAHGADKMTKHGARTWTCTSACVTVRSVLHDSSLRGCGACARSALRLPPGGMIVLAAA